MSYPAAASGSVALDIGDGFGALIVHAVPRRTGEEVEVIATDGRRTHVSVLAHDLAGGNVATAAVFGSLPAGVYRLHAGTSRQIVSVTDGAITEVAVKH